MEDILIAITDTEQNKDKIMERKEDILRGLWDNIKCMNLHIIWVPERKERKNQRNI